MLLLGGSWVVISGVISPLIWVISIVTLLITPLMTTHEPPSIINLAAQPRKLNLSRFCSCDAAMWERVVFVVSEFAAGRAGGDDRTWSEEFFFIVVIIIVIIIIIILILTLKKFCVLFMKAWLDVVVYGAKHLVSRELEASKTHRAPNDSDQDFLKDTELSYKPEAEIGCSLGTGRQES